MKGNLNVTSVTQASVTLPEADEFIAQIVQDIPESESHVAVVDPHPHAAGEHLVGVGVGAALGGAAGALAGAVASVTTGIATGLVLGGPVGGVVGLVAGAVVGGMLGNSIGEVVNPGADESHWSHAYQSEPYYLNGYTFDDYRPAYRTGYEGYGAHPGMTFEDAEYRLQEDYVRLRGNSRLGWLDARPAALAAWERRATSLEMQES